MAHFTYIYDTYCGWCYGAAPVISALIDSGADVTVLHRHLFQGANAHRMGDGFGQMALKYDKRIGQLTGQEFSQAYADKLLRDPNEVLASGLTAQAAALVHDQGAKVEMALAHILQQARYVDGVSASDSKVVRDALAKFDVSVPLSHGVQRAAEISADAAALQARNGAQGVPMLLREHNSNKNLIDISAYYAAPADISKLAA